MGSRLDLSGSRDHSIPHRPFLLVVLWNQASSLCLTVSEIFIGECDAMVDMTLNVLYAKIKVIHFGSNRSFLRLLIGCQW